MRVLITGATGLIGKELGKKLVANGHSLTVVSRNPAKAQAELPFPARVVEWKGGDEPFPSAALENVDGIVNLIGESVADGRWTAERKRTIRDSRVLSTRSLVEAVAKLAKKPKVLVQGSAIGIYGDRKDEVLTESSAPGEGFLANVVREWEKEALVAETLGLRFAVVRTGVVLAAGGGAFAVAQIFESNGAFLGQQNLTAESVAENWSKISDMTGSKAYFMGGEQTQKFFARISGN